MTGLYIDSNSGENNQKGEMRMGSTEKISELMALLDMNDHFLNDELTSLRTKINVLFDDRIRIISDQLISGKYTDIMQRSEKQGWWNIR